MSELRLEIVEQDSTEVTIKTNVYTLRMLGRDPGAFRPSIHDAEMLAHKTFIAARNGVDATYSRQPALYAAAAEVLAPINMTIAHIAQVDMWLKGYPDLRRAKRIRLRFRFTKSWETEMIFPAEDWEMLKPAFLARVGLFIILEASMESSRQVTHTASLYNPNKNYLLEIEEFETGYKYRFGAGGLTVRHGTEVIDNQTVNKKKTDTAKIEAIVAEVMESLTDAFIRLRDPDPCLECPYKDSDDCSEGCEYRSKLINGPCGGPPP